MKANATADNMTPAYEGLGAVLNETAPVAMLTDVIKKCA